MKMDVFVRVAQFDYFHFPNASDSCTLINKRLWFIVYEN